MKTTTLENLITARILLSEAERHCSQGDRYSSTAGLIVLQDAVELVFMAILIEKEVDEQRGIEGFSFDETVAAVKKLGIKVPKSAKLKAMNKLRVTAKHYGEIMDPSTVQNHLDSAKISVDIVLTEAIGRPLREIYVTELLGDSRSRWHLDNAITALSEGRYVDAMVAARKGFYLEFEAPYCIYHYRSSSIYSEFAFYWDGAKAKPEVRNPEWIKNNVNSPFEFIQIDHDRWRVDSLEWGINTQLLNNVRRLTPDVILLDAEDKDRTGRWAVQQHISHHLAHTTRETAVLCVDLVIEALRRKYSHSKAAKDNSSYNASSLPKDYIGQPIYTKASEHSDVKYYIADGDETKVAGFLDGFFRDEKFYFVLCVPKNSGIYTGYLKEIPGTSLDKVLQSQYESAFLKYHMS
jgi:hypothetical protein